MIHLWTSASLLKRQQRRIGLVVDGDAAFRHFALRAMQRCGCAAVGLEDAEEALKWLDDSERAPALISIDATLRGMNGFDLCRALRTHSRSAASPILCASSLTTLDDHLASLRAGADAFLAKPIRPDVYLDTVERLLRVGSHIQRVQGDWLADRGM